MAGIQVQNPSGVAPLALVNLPQGGAQINPNAFAGDGGESYVRGIAAAQSVLKPLADNVLAAVNYNKPENVLARKVAAQKLESESVLIPKQLASALAEAELNQLIDTRAMGKVGGNLGNPAAANPATEASALTETDRALSTQNSMLDRAADAKIAKRLGIADPNKKQEEIKANAVKKATEMLMASGRYKDGMTEAQIMAEAGSRNVYTKEQLESVNKLRDDFNKDKSIEKAVAAEGALQVILRGLQDNNGPGDIAAINQFQSGMVDPGATVREGDVALMRAASPLMARLKSYIPQLIKGGTLPPEMREQIKSLAVGIAKERATHANEKVIPQYQKLSTKASVDFEDFGRLFEIADIPGATPAAAPAASLPGGKAPISGATPSGGTFKIKGSK